RQLGGHRHGDRRPLHGGVRHDEDRQRFLRPASPGHGQQEQGCRLSNGASPEHPERQPAVTRIWNRRLPSLLLAVGLVWLAGTIAILPGSRADPGTAPVAQLNDPGAVLKGTVTLTATVTPSAGRTVSSVLFEQSAAAAGQWSPIATVTTPPYTAALDTTSLTDGSYDFRVTATDSAGETGSSPTLTRPIDNPSPPPTVSLTDPGQTLKGIATLRASASAAPGRTIVSVKFEYSPAASDTWTSLG